MFRLTKGSGHTWTVFIQIYKYLNYLLEHLPDIEITDIALGKLAPLDENVMANCSGTM